MYIVKLFIREKTNLEKLAEQWCVGWWHTHTPAHMRICLSSLSRHICMQCSCNYSDCLHLGLYGSIVLWYSYNRNNTIHIHMCIMCGKVTWLFYPHCVWGRGRKIANSSSFSSPPHHSLSHLSELYLHAIKSNFHLYPSSTIYCFFFLMIFTQK